MPTELKRIETAKLLLDVNNPRLPLHLRGADDSRIIEYMILQAATLDLMEAIATSGFFEGEHLLVVEADDGRYRVIEGNRRLVAVLLLLDPSRAPVQQSRVQAIFDGAEHRCAELEALPCAVFEDEDVIHRYLGYRHITGVQPWNLRQRAEYLNSQLEEMYSERLLDDACRDLARAIGSRRDYVKRIIVGFRIYKMIRENGFFGIQGLNAESFYFNYIADSLRQPNIRAFLGVDLSSAEPISSLDLASLEQWTRWLFEKYGENQTRLKGRAEDLGWLNAVLANPDAKRAFESGEVSLRDAFELTSDLEVVFRAAVAHAVSDLERADRLTHKIDCFYAELEDHLRVVARLAMKIRKTTHEPLEDDSDGN